MPSLHNRVLEPFYCSLEGLIPWPRYLQNKTILIISPFTESFKKQRKNGFTIFKNKNDQVFESTQKFIFYKSFNTLVGNHIHRNWEETLNIMRDDAKVIRFSISPGIDTDPINPHIDDIIGRYHYPNLKKVNTTYLFTSFDHDMMKNLCISITRRNDSSDVLKVLKPFMALDEQKKYCKVSKTDEMGSFPISLPRVKNGMKVGIHNLYFGIKRNVPSH